MLWLNAYAASSQQTLNWRNIHYTTLNKPDITSQRFWNVMLDYRKSQLATFVFSHKK